MIDLGVELAEEDFNKNGAAPLAQASFTIYSKSLLRVLAFSAGAAAVCAGFTFLQFVGSLFLPAIPFIFGGVLFITMVAAFFTLLQALKKFRRRKSGWHISPSEIYTALSIFIVMGLFAMACMHAFLEDGLALTLWTEGVVTSLLAIAFFGAGKFFVSIFNEGKTSS